MTVSFFRSQRIETELFFNVRLLEKRSNIVLPGEIEVKTQSISRDGACVLLSKIFHGPLHLFFSTLKNANHKLSLHLTAGLDQQWDDVIVAHSIWMDSCHQAPYLFKLGLEFEKKQSEFFRLTQQNQKGLR